MKEEKRRRKKHPSKREATIIKKTEGVKRSLQTRSKKQKTLQQYSTIMYMVIIPK